LPLLIPATLSFLGLRSLIVAEKLLVPAWCDYFWFTFTTSAMLNRPRHGADAPSA
jgi:hypothetical protein